MCDGSKVHLRIAADISAQMVRCPAASEQCSDMERKKLRSDLDGTQVWVVASRLADCTLSGYRLFVRRLVR